MPPPLPLPLPLPVPRSAGLSSPFPGAFGMPAPRQSLLLQSALQQQPDVQQQQQQHQQHQALQQPMMMPAMSHMSHHDTLLQMQMQMQQLQCRMVCLHQTLEVLTVSMNEMMAMMQTHVMATTERMNVLRNERGERDGGSADGDPVGAVGAPAGGDRDDVCDEDASDDECQAMSMVVVRRRATAV